MSTAPAGGGVVKPHKFQYSEEATYNIL